MLRFTGVRFWSVTTGALDEMRQFYCDVLGGREVGSGPGRPPAINGVPVTYLDLGPITVRVFDAPLGASSAPTHHAFDIEAPEDPGELVKELESRGGWVDKVRPHTDGPGYSVYLNDPVGNRIELYHLPT